MKEMMLLIKQNKGFYLTIFSFLAIFAVRGTMFLQSNPVQRAEMCTIIILALLIPFELGFGGNMDIRKKEFEEKLPVKKVFLEMSSYVVMFAMSFLCALLSVITSVWTDKDRVDGYRFAGLQGSEFAYLLLEVWTTMTFFYLFALIFRKFIHGFVLACSCWFGVTNWLDYICEFGKRDWIDSFVEKQPIWMIILILLMNVIMILHSKYRDLSSGKICYFKALDIGVVVLIGYIVYNCFEWLIDRGKGISLLAAGTAVILLLVKMYAKKQHVSKLEVTSKKEIKRPVLSWEFGRYLFLGVILTTILMGNSAEMRKAAYQNAEWLAEWGVENAQTYEVGGEDRYDMLSAEVEYIKEYELSWIRESKTSIMIIAFGLFFLIAIGVEGKKGTREFWERLPISRRERYRTKTLLEIAVLIVPLVLDTVVNVLCYVSASKYGQFAGYTEICMLYVKDGVWWAFVLCGIVMIFIGVEKLVDAVVENENLKRFNLIWILFGFLAISILLYPIRMEKTAVPMVLIAILNIAVGLVLIRIAGKLCEKRDQARAFYYFKPALYLFTCIYSVLYAVMVVPAAQMTKSIVWYILAVVGVVFVWGASIHFCSSPREKLSVK